MDIAILIPFLIALLSPLLIYLYKSPLSRTDSCEIKNNIFADDPKKSTSKVKPKAMKKQITKSNPECVIEKQQIKPTSNSKQKPPNRKISEKSPNTKSAEPKKSLVPITYDDSDETPNKDWIPVETKRKVKTTPKLTPDAEDVSKKSDPKPIITSPRVSTFSSKNMKLETPNKALDTVVTASPNINVSDTVKMERDALRVQISLMLTENFELKNKLEASEHQNKSLLVKIADQNKNHLKNKSGNEESRDNHMHALESKITEYSNQIEALKKSLSEKSQPDKNLVDPVIVGTLQSEISRLARELTLSKQKNESLSVRLDYAERELANARSQDGPEEVVVIEKESSKSKKESSKSLEPAKNKTADDLAKAHSELNALKQQIEDDAEKLTKLSQERDSFSKQVNLLQSQLDEKNKINENLDSSNIKQIQQLTERLEASDQICQHNFAQMEKFKSELQSARAEAEENKTLLSLREDEINGLKQQQLKTSVSNTNLEADLKQKDKELSELNCQLKGLNHLKSQLETQVKLAAETRKPLEAELCKLKEQVSQKSKSKTDQAVNGSSNVSELLSAIKELSKSSSKSEKIDILVPKLESLAHSLNLESIDTSQNLFNSQKSTNGHSTENGVPGLISKRTRLASKDQLTQLTLENNKYKELLNDTENTLSALQNSVIQEQARWQQQLKEEQAARNKLEQQLLSLKQQSNKDTTAQK